MHLASYYQKFLRLCRVLPVHAQTLLERYQRLRTEKLAEDAFNQRGHRLSVKAPVLMASDADSIVRQIALREGILADESFS